MLQHRLLPPARTLPAGMPLLPAWMHPTCAPTTPHSHTTATAHMHAAATARSHATPHACTTTLRSHSHASTPTRSPHAAATARCMHYHRSLARICHHTLNPHMRMPASHRTNLHPALHICMPHTRTCNRHARRPRPLGGQISGEGGDRDLLGGAATG
jgi:hypothetical protein